MNKLAIPDINSHMTERAFHGVEEDQVAGFGLSSADVLGLVVLPDGVGATEVDAEAVQRLKALGMAP